MLTIDRDWFKIWTKSNYPSPESEFGIITSVYSPHFLSEGDRAEDDGYSCALTFGIFLNQRNEYNMILFSVFPLRRLDSHELIIHVNNLCNDYLNNSSLNTYKDRSPAIVIIPHKGEEFNTLLDEVSKKNPEILIRRFLFDDYGKTVEGMLTNVIPVIKSGKIWVCAKPNEIDELRNMDEGFLEIISGYPSIQSQSMVWALCQAVLEAKRYGLFERDFGIATSRSRIKIYGEA